jgi:hypothetical protein
MESSDAVAGKRKQESPEDQQEDEDAKLNIKEAATAFNEWFYSDEVE